MGGQGQGGAGREMELPKKGERRDTTGLGYLSFMEVVQLHVFWGLRIWVPPTAGRKDQAVERPPHPGVPPHPLGWQ
jgi:hypothetical protein